MIPSRMTALLALALLALAGSPPAAPAATTRPHGAAAGARHARAPARDDSLAMRRGIDQANRDYIEAFKRGDAQAIAAVYAPDAAQLRPGGQILRGRVAIAANLVPLLQRIHFINGTIASSSLWRVDDLVYDVGHYTFVFQPAGKDTLVEQSRYLDIWKRQADGTWRIWRDVPVPRE